MSTTPRDLERGDGRISRRSSSQTLTNSSNSITNFSRKLSLNREQKRTPNKPPLEAGGLPCDKMPRREMEKSRSRLKQYFFLDLERAYMSGALMVCFFISGLVDSVAFNSWNCFVNMQTGEHSDLPTVPFSRTPSTGA
jgi:hypothetical protein